MHLHPPGRRKIFRRNLHGKFVSALQHSKCNPQSPGRARVNFRTFLLCGEDLELRLVALDRLLKATTKKGRQLFEEKKCTPLTNPGYAYDSNGDTVLIQASCVCVLQLHSYESSGSCSSTQRSRWWQETVGEGDACLPLLVARGEALSFPGEATPSRRPVLDPAPRSY